MPVQTRRKTTQGVLGKIQASQSRERCPRDHIEISGTKLVAEKVADLQFRQAIEQLKVLENEVSAILEVRDPLMAGLYLGRIIEWL